MIYLLLLIARSKLVPDFACTIHILHLLVTSLYTRSVPSSLPWWVLQVASTALMTVLGVWACRYRELRPISFGVSAAGTAARGQSVREGGDEETGFAVGRGRGRGRDGAGKYEMVEMGEREGEARSSV